MAGPFYFAWTDADALPWDSSYVREDEDVFSFSMTHTEGDFPVLEVVIENPRVGLLANSRKQWAWLSYQPEGGDAVPLFYGRLLGVPQNLEDNFIRVTFVARPSDFEEQKEALAVDMRQLPEFDPVWLPEEERDNPDLVLEGRTAMWHIDRITHEVTVSDIIVGEDGSEADVLSEADGLYDGLEVSYSTSPVSKVVVHAEVGWQQRGTGTIDLTQQIISEFAAITPASVQNFKGQDFSTTGQIVSIGGEQLQNVWPDPERRIGGGWSVGASSLTLIGQPPLPALGMENEVFNLMKNSDPTNASYNTRASGILQTIRDVLTRTPGYVVQVVHHSLEDDSNAADQVDFVIVPVWRMSPQLEVVWTADRTRMETMDFELTAEVQPLLTDPGEEGVAYLSLGPSYVDDFIEDSRHASYFKTQRGLRSVEHLIARARAMLIARARAVDVSVTAAFDVAFDWSCRMNLAIQDSRLPGGIVQGKVKAYRLTVDGDSGEMYSSVTIGCTVGKDGSITPVTGDPVYVEDGYVNSGYQLYSGSVAVFGAGDVGYSGVLETPVNDDGQNLFSVTAASHLLDIGASGGLVTQEQQLNVNSVNPDAIYVVDRVNSVRVDAWVEMKPVTGGPFLTEFRPTLTELAVPKTIDLEVA